MYHQTRPGQLAPGWKLDQLTRVLGVKTPPPQAEGMVEKSGAGEIGKGPAPAQDRPAPPRITNGRGADPEPTLTPAQGRLW